MAASSPESSGPVPDKTPLWKRVWQWVKTPWDIIKIFKTLVGLVSAAMVVLNVAAAGSNVLRAFILVFGAVGAVAGYFITVGMWKDTPRPFRRKLAALFIFVWFLTLFLQIIVFTALDATLTRDYEAIARLHDLMVDFVYVTDFGLGLLTLFNFYCLVGSFTVLSPGMDV